VTAKKWYFQLWVLAVAIFLAGPFALPLAWLNPNLKKPAKVIITIVVVVLSIWIVYASIEMVKLLLREVGDLQKVMR
jgi:hypothetical protein